MMSFVKMKSKAHFFGVDMDLENLNREILSVADDMLAKGVPIFYRDENCKGTDFIIRELPDGTKALVKVEGEVIIVVKNL